IKSESQAAGDTRTPGYVVDPLKERRGRPSRAEEAEDEAAEDVELAVSGEEGSVEGREDTDGGADLPGMP
ncbi:MAG: hypothetical protein II967_02460, partial [Deltaproteobacteria bacterium]|nr:hypothetical protein [Deltaproteobacteria bacterium]